MKTSLSSMHSSSEIKKMIDELDHMADEDVQVIYGVDTVDKAKTLLSEEYQEAVENEEHYEGIDIFQAQGFAGAYEYNRMKY